MIRLTRQTDYAIVLLVRIAGDASPATHNARELARDCKLPLPMVSKILKCLARDGLLSSQRGVHGGYSLARPADRISIAEVVASTEGPIAMTECTSGEPNCCSQESHCGVRANWQLINRTIRAALERVTLADMARPMAEPGLLNLTSHKPLGAPAPLLEPR